MIKINRERCANNASTNSYEAKPNFCPKFFDGILCWDETMAGTTAYQQCPDWFIGFQNKKESAYRNCLKDATWQPKQNSNGTYTDYRACIKDNDAILLAVSTNPRFRSDLI